MTTLPLLDHPIVLAAAIEARDEIAYHALPDAEIDWSALRDWFARRLCDLSLTASRDWWVRWGAKQEIARCVAGWHKNASDLLPYDSIEKWIADDHRDIRAKWNTLREYPIDLAAAVMAALETT